MPKKYHFLLFTVQIVLAVNSFVLFLILFGVTVFFWQGSRNKKVKTKVSTLGLGSRLVKHESWYRDLNCDYQIWSLDIETGIKSFRVLILRLVLKLKKWKGSLWSVKNWNSWKINGRQMDLSARLHNFMVFFLSGTLEFIKSPDVCGKWNFLPFFFLPLLIVMATQGLLVRGYFSDMPSS